MYQVEKKERKTKRLMSKRVFEFLLPHGSFLQKFFCVEIHYWDDLSPCFARR